MTQSNFVIPDGYISATIPVIQAMLQALASNSLATTAPSTTYAGQYWLDTTANQLKLRNAANSAWIVIGTFDFTAGTFSPALSGDLAAAGALTVAGLLAAPKAFLPITTGGTGTAYTISTGATAYVDGQNYRFALHATNGAAPTLQDGSLAAVPFKVDNAGTLAAPAAGQMVINTVIEAVYSGSAAAMVVTSGLFATAAVAATGTATGIPVDPAGVAAAIAAIPAPTPSAPTTAQVESAMAGANAQEVGTFGVFAYTSSGNTISAGINYAGSSLSEAVIGVPDSGTGPMNGGALAAHPAGTWKAMTSCGSQTGYFPTATFLRIA